MKIEKAREIIDAKISFISLVDKAANKKKFLIAKAASDGAAFTCDGKILKVDEGLHYLTGIVYEPMTEDSHGDFMSVEEIRKAAYWFAKNGDKVDLQHSFKNAEGVTVVENFVTPWEISFAGTLIKVGTWIVTVEVRNESIWNSVLRGEITGFSMGGVGKIAREEKDLALLEEPLTEDGKGKRGLLKWLSGELSALRELVGGSIFELEEECSMSKEEISEMLEERIIKAMKELLGGELQKIVEPMIDECVNKAVQPLQKACALPTSSECEAVLHKSGTHFLSGII